MTITGLYGQKRFYFSLAVCVGVCVYRCLDMLIFLLGHTRAAECDR